MGSHYKGRRGMIRTFGDFMAALGVILVVGVLVMWMLSIAADRADAAPSQGSPCGKPFPNQHSQQAERCRSNGWLIGPGYTVSPTGVLRYMYLPTCRKEDGDTRSCEINVTGRFGDGCGDALLYLRSNGNERWVHLFRWEKYRGDWRLMPWVRCS